MKIGSLVYATEQGLGILAKDFYDNNILTDVVCVQHQHRTNHCEKWYGKNVMEVPAKTWGRCVLESVLEFIDEMDVMLFFETPFNWELIEQCRRLGTVSILMTMYECTPERLPQIPDVFFCPSLLDSYYFVHHESILYDEGFKPFTLIPGKCETDLYYTPIPIPRHIQHQQRRTTRKFVHNAGHGGLKGRNGTTELLEGIYNHCQVIRHQDDVQFTIRAQKSTTELMDYVRLFQNSSLKDKVNFEIGKTIPHDQLYSDGDVFVFPEKFNGLSLPLQEAFASGMIVMGSQRFPMNWLPSQPMIWVDSFERERIGPGYLEYDKAVVLPEHIGNAIDRVYEFPSNLTEMLSNDGNTYRELNSWDVLREKYWRILTDLVF